MLSICSQEGKDKRISASKWLSNNRKYEYVCENILSVAFVMKRDICD